MALDKTTSQNTILVGAKPEGMLEICFALEANEGWADLRVRSDGKVFLGSAMTEAQNSVRMNGMSFLAEGAKQPNPLTFTDFSIANGEGVLEHNADAQKPAVLAHYTTFSSLEKIIESNSLRFSSFSNANDDFEKQDWMFDLYCVEQPAPERGAIEFSHDFSKVTKGNMVFASFSIEYVNSIENESQWLEDCTVWKHPSMWASYSRRHANSETGAVLLFDRNRLLVSTSKSIGKNATFSGKVLYGPKESARRLAFRIEYDVFKEIGLCPYASQHLSKFWKELLLAKYEGWKHEQEFRIVVNSPDASPLFAPLGNSLLKVLVGEGLSSSELSTLKDKLDGQGIGVNVVRWRNGIPNVVV